MSFANEKKGFQVILMEKWISIFKMFHPPQIWEVCRLQIASKIASISWKSLQSANFYLYKGFQVRNSIPPLF